MNHENELRVLVIAAHPDDAELSCGGTIANWINEGRRVFYVVCTNGDKGTHDRTLSQFALADMREAEQNAAAGVLGVEEVVFLRRPDGGLEESMDLRAELAMLIRYYRPQIILTHDGWRPYQIHPDHRVTGIMACDAIVSARDHLFLPAMNAVGLEAYAPAELYLWGTDSPDYFEDISATIEKKIEAVSQHHTQLRQMPGWEDRVQQWASATGREAGYEYAEAFKRTIFRPAGHVFPRGSRAKE